MIFSSHAMKVFACGLHVLNCVTLKTSCERIQSELPSHKIEENANILGFCSFDWLTNNICQGWENLIFTQSLQADRTTSKNHIPNKDQIPKYMHIHYKLIMYQRKNIFPKAGCLLFFFFIIILVTMNIIPIVIIILIIIIIIITIISIIISIISILLIIIILGVEGC